jgi:hypothetical protein
MDEVAKEKLPTHGWNRISAFLSTPESCLSYHCLHIVTRQNFTKCCS